MIQARVTDAPSARAAIREVEKFVNRRTAYAARELIANSLEHGDRATVRVGNDRVEIEQIGGDSSVLAEFVNDPRQAFRGRPGGVGLATLAANGWRIIVNEAPRTQAIRIEAIAH